MNSLEMPPVSEAKPKPANLDPRPELEPYRAKLKPRDQFPKEEQEEMQRLRKLIMQDAGILPKEPELTAEKARGEAARRSWLESLGFKRKERKFATDPATYYNENLDN